MKGGPMPQVTSSGAEGLEKIVLTLSKTGGNAGTATPCTIRLFFAEPGNTKPGNRVFDVAVQGKTVLENVDITRETAPATGLVKELAGIKVGDTLTVELKPKAGKTLLCGVELIRN
jgi:hypothetical protein